MIQSPLLLGILAGCLLGIPVGPNGALCLYRSLQFGWLQGVVSAFGSVTAMCVCSIVSAMLLSDVVEMMARYAGRDLIDRIGGVILVAIGVMFYTASRRTKAAPGEERSNGTTVLNFLSAFLIGIANPKNIFGFASLLIAYNSEIKDDISSGFNAACFGCGVFVSTGLLFLLLIYSAAKYGQRWLDRILSRLKYWVSGVFVLTGVVRIIAAI